MTFSQLKLKFTEWNLDIWTLLELMKAQLTQLKINSKLNHVVMINQDLGLLTLLLGINIIFIGKILFFNLFRLFGIDFTTFVV